MKSIEEPEYLTPTRDNPWVPWPENEPRRRLMNSNFPCDMWTGPCSCGSWHEEGE